jgi:hypothetical protein
MQLFRHNLHALSSQSKEGEMFKHVDATLVFVSTLALLVGILHYEPPAGSNIEKVQHNKGHCEKGKTQCGNHCC